MLFSSQVFILVFLPLVLLAYYFFHSNLKLRTWILIIVSVIFYGYWDVMFIPLLVGSVIVNWLLSHYHNKIPLKRLIISGVCFNLLILGFFKYFNFFSSILIDGFHSWNIILPLGISFFTFQQISYLIDLHKGRAPKYDFSHYFLYVVFFPQLIAGPIVRHDELIPQLDNSPIREGLYERLSRGSVLFVLGLAKKVLIADQMINASDTLFGAAAVRTLSFAEGWIAALAYSMQLYFDFSAYSDMAIGLGLLFGFVLPINFDAPYKAVSLRDFWRRWHMTLTRFLRDYVYIPLGGNRHGLVNQVKAIMITMFLCGLWHGAGWTFIVWGVMHGVGIAANNVWKKMGYSMPTIIGWLLTIIFVIFGWVLFRAENFVLASSIMSSMVGFDGISLHLQQEVRRMWLIPVAAVMAIYGPTAMDFSLNKLKPGRLTAVIFAVLLTYIVLEVGKGQVNEFIYFQF